MRTPYRLFDLALVAVGVLTISVLLGFVGPHLDDHGGEMRQSQNLSDAQRQAQRELHRDLAAAALCREQHGEASYQWTAAGELVCIPRHGHKVLASNP